LHELFGLPAAPGFSDWITVGTDEAPLALAASGVEGLRILPAGSPAAVPADLLTSRRLEALVSNLKSQADFVLFDAPPLLAVSDAALLAANLDGVLLAVSAGQTRRDHAQRAKELLEKIKVRVVGAVLTNAAPEGGLGSY
jgi:non-specific protein-tyrosine kinase